jgi:serine protease Do
MDITSALTEASSELIQQISESIVVLHNGSHGVGAGVIWSANSHGKSFILTNNHVIAHGREFKVEMYDGKVYGAQLLAQDPEIDLALLEVDSPNLPRAKISSSSTLRVGELVLAIGHPWGQRGTVTAGLISAVMKVKRRGQSREIEIIRSDASLAPGNSGGPLMNAQGDVIGINTMIIGGDQGIAIPSSVAREFVDQANRSS